VARVSRPALRLGACSLLLLAGAASSLLAAGGSAVRAGTTTTTATVTTVTNPAPVVLAVSGHGWGHGLGLSQWGAYGYAKHGWTYDQILAHYYTGTTLGPAPVLTVRVLLAQKKKVTLDSATAWTMADAAGTKVTLDPGTMSLGPKLAVADHPELQPPYTFTGKQPLAVDGKQYRGRLLVSSDGKKLDVVDVVALENYLKGVVPAEMPSGWPAEALKAQAVAARSYALANLHKGQNFDLYADTRDQVYGGTAAESQAASDAIAATKGEVVLWNGNVADTLFFSTSGGRTNSALDATGSAVPYLVSVADPYDTLSPYHDWGPVLFDGASVAKQLKLPPPVSDLTAVTGSSGRTKKVTAVGANNTQATVTGAQFRALLGLRSTWFSGALFSLQPAAKTITYGGAASLSGFARGADSLSLESKAPGKDWAPAADLLVGADGSFSTVVRPALGTQYRLAWTTVRAGLAKIAVAPKVDAQPATGGVVGAERPAVAGAPVLLQQQDGTAWATLSSTTADATGAFTLTGPLQPGTYRVRCAPGHGLVPGVSLPLRVE
jgi:stage II sporulation protein D